MSSVQHLRAGRQQAARASELKPTQYILTKLDTEWESRILSGGAFIGRCREPGIRHLAASHQATYDAIS